MKQRLQGWRIRIKPGAWLKAHLTPDLSYEYVFVNKAEDAMFHTSLNDIQHTLRTMPNIDSYRPMINGDFVIEAIWINTDDDHMGVEPD